MEYLKKIKQNSNKLLLSLKETKSENINININNESGFFLHNISINIFKKTKKNKCKFIFLI